MCDVLAVSGGSLAPRARATDSNQLASWDDSSLLGFDVRHPNTMEG
jgi:hypothetical protein